MSGATSEMSVAAYARRFAFKVWAVSAALVSVSVGLLLTLFFYAGWSYLVERLLGTAMVEKIQAALEGIERLPLVGELTVPLSEGALLIGASVINAVLLLVLLIVGTALAWWGGRRASERGAGPPYGRFCVGATRGSRFAALLHIVHGLLLATAAFVFVTRFIGLGPVVRIYPLLVGLALGFVALGLGTLFELPRLLDDEEEAEPPGESIPEPAPRRLTADELLDALRRSDIYRRQVVADAALQATPVRDGPAQDSALELLLRRYPKLRSILPHTGIHSLTEDQDLALRMLLDDDQARRGAATGNDFMFVGWPGAGRSTIANLAALGAVLHREGALYCITATDRLWGSGTTAGSSAALVRHPGIQLQRWLRAAGEEVVVAEAYEGQTAAVLDLTRSPGIVFTDVRYLSKAVLSQATGDARALLQGLRYVIIDHPERLDREDLIRLRSAIARLRVTADLSGSAPTFILLVPPLDNQALLSKEILAHADVPFLHFASNHLACRVVGWLPPLEVDAEAERLRLVRAPFADEVTRLLVALGEQLGQEGTVARVAIVDGLPLLGPELRETIRAQVRDRLARRLPASRASRGTVSWYWFADHNIAVDRQQRFDVIVAMGIGSHPGRIVNSLRAALVEDGAVILVGDSSPADVESLRLISRPGWSPTGRDEHSSHGGADVTGSVAIPGSSQAVVAHELAALFEDFDGRAIRRRRLEELFAGRFTGTLLDGWLADELLVTDEVFGRYAPGVKPAHEKVLRRADRALTAARYEVPWGCCSRRVLRVYDVSARSFQPAGPYFNAFIDQDRLFVDFHARAVLRFPPHSVEVQGVTLEASVDDGATRAIIAGRVDVRTGLFSEHADIDRRAPRYEIAVLGEEPTSSRDLTEADAALLDGHPLRGSLVVGAGDDEELTRRRRQLLRSLRKSGQQQKQGRATRQLLVGTWSAELREVLRDVAETDARLVGEPEYTRILEFGLGERHTRAFRTRVVSLFPLRSGDEGEPAAYPALHAFARSLTTSLRRRILAFDREYRVSVQPAGELTDGQERRVLIHRVRGEELDSEEPLFEDWLEEPDKMSQILNEMHDRLVACDCDDGCARCCGGLGALPSTRAEEFVGYEPADLVSRRGAYVLVCEILGRDPDWTRFVAEPPEAVEPEPLADDVLQRLYREIVGTPESEHRDGTWHRLLGHLMELPAGKIPPARFATSEASDWAGLYVTPDNIILVRPDIGEEYLKEVLFHELTHGWQYQSGVFDLERHRLSPQARRFFDGSLVIEGHAVWTEHRFRYSEGLGPAYTPDDSRPWNEYKVGFMLLQKLERALGEFGLHGWLASPDSGLSARPSPESGLAVGFTLEDALKTFGLLAVAQAGSFTSLDIAERLESSSEGDAPAEA